MAKTTLADRESAALSDQALDSAVLSESHSSAIPGNIPGPTSTSKGGVKLTKAPNLDRITKAVAGAFFGMMRPDSESHLHFGLRQGRPTVEVERALNILEAHGLVSRTPDERGGVTYRPLKDMSAYRAAANLGIRLTERLALGDRP